MYGLICEEGAAHSVRRDPGNDHKEERNEGEEQGDRQRGPEWRGPVDGPGWSIPGRDVGSQQPQ